MAGIAKPGPRRGARAAGGTRGAGRGSGRGAARSQRPRPGSRLHRARRARARRWLAAILGGLAIWVGLSTVAPADATDSGLPTVVAVRSIPAGARIVAADLAVERRPDVHRPLSATTELSTVVGRRAAGPIEPRGVVTTERLLGPGLLAGAASSDRVAMTVPVLELALTGVRRGGRVDVYATGTGQRVVTNALVLAVSGDGTGTAGSPPSDQGSEGAGGTESLWAASADPGVTLAVPPLEAVALARDLSALGAGEGFVLALRGES